MRKVLFYVSETTVFVQSVSAKSNWESSERCTLYAKRAVSLKRKKMSLNNVYVEGSPVTLLKDK